MLIYLKQLLCNHVETTKILEKTDETFYNDEGTGGYGSMYQRQTVKSTCLKCGKVTIKYVYKRV